MAYNEEVAVRLREVLAQVPEVVERKMFGGLCFMVRGHMALGVMADHLVLRLGDGVDGGLREPHTAPMDFTGRVMKSMLYVHPPGFDGDALAEWVGRALVFVDTLPPK